MRFADSRFRIPRYSPSVIHYTREISAKFLSTLENKIFKSLPEGEKIFDGRRGEKEIIGL